MIPVNTAAVDVLRQVGGFLEMYSWPSAQEKQADYESVNSGSMGGAG